LEGLFDYSLWGLFLASFLAATVVPFSSEALLYYLIINGTDAYTAVLVASAGNWLGGMSSYAIGYLDNCSLHAGRKIPALCDLGMADRTCILIIKNIYFYEPYKF
jgi:hypothetical protein